MPELVQFKYETIQKYVLNFLYETTVFSVSNVFRHTCLVNFTFVIDLNIFVFHELHFT